MAKSNLELFQLSGNDLIAEIAFLNQNQIQLEELGSNHDSIKNQLSQLNELSKRDFAQIENLIELDMGLSKINTYIAMAWLNTVENHQLRLSYLTRMPTLFFKLHINKLSIIKELQILGVACRIKTLPKEIGWLQQLKRLDLSGCQLLQIPKEIGKLEHLEQLNLNYNRLTEIPTEIGDLHSLKVLQLSMNPALTQLPESIGDLQSLEVLAAHHDALTTTPKSLKKMQALKELDLDYNLIREIPLDLSLMPNLRVFKALHNPFDNLAPEIRKLIH